MVELVVVLSLIFYVNGWTTPDWYVGLQYTVYNYLMGWYTCTNLIEGKILIIMLMQYLCSKCHYHLFSVDLVVDQPFVRISSGKIDFQYANCIYFLFVDFSVLNPQTSVFILSSCFRLVMVLPPLY